MSREVIMPALGMAQTSGLIVAWLKKPGDAVKTGEALMQVETDKAVVEVEAQADGFLCDVRVAAGEAAPVGEVIAMIADGPAAADAQSRAEEPARAEPAPPVPAAAAPKRPAAAARAAPAPIGQQIFASPKARRLAAEQGLDLSRLSAAGVPQPYLSGDLATLRALPAAGAPPVAASREAAPAPRRLTARVRGEGFAGFSEWMRAETGARADAGSIMAAMAAAALRQESSDATLVVAVETYGQARRYADPDRSGLGGAIAGETSVAPALVLRDLRGTAFTALEMGGEGSPVLSVIREGSDLVITLECAPSQLEPKAAVELISGFAGRLAEPLRHLL